MLVPIATPVTIPDVTPTVAIGGVLLVQMPGVGVLASVVVVPIHTLVLPVIGVGYGFTVTTRVE